MMIPCKKSKDNRSNHKQLLIRYSRLISSTSNNVRHRLKVLKLAEETGNVSESCRLTMMDRTSFYNYRKRFEKYGVKGLKNLSPVCHNHPQTTPSSVVEKILSFSSENPGCGCKRISKMLKSKSISTSHQTVQDILAENGLRTLRQRRLKSGYSIVKSVSNGG